MRNHFDICEAFLRQSCCKCHDSVLGAGLDFNFLAACLRRLRLARKFSANLSSFESFDFNGVDGFLVIDQIRPISSEFQQRTLS